MDGSSPPPPPAAAARSPRPGYLVAAMVVTWIVGVQGMASGFATAAFLRGGTLGGADDLARAAGGEPMEQLLVVYVSAERSALALAHSTAFPLAVAAILLSAVLVLASGFALVGRKGAQSFALQALATNAGLAVLSYLLLEPVRATAVAATLEASRAMTLGPLADTLGDGTFWVWVGRTRLYLGELGVLALAALALTRPRVTAYFRASEAASEQAEEP